jgi:hypothetical protein
MGGKRWTKEELEYLENWYGKKSFEEMSAHLGRSISSIQTKGPTLGLNAQTDHWTEGEDQFLRENYLVLGADETAERLGRTVHGVHGRVLKIGAGRPSIGPKVVWNDEDKDFLRENYQRLSWEELVQKLGRTEQAIKRRGSMLGLQKYIDAYPFFETWTEESAYTIGFFAADGWVDKRGPESIRINFGQKDPDILYSIRDAIGVGEVYPKKKGMHEYYIQSVRAYDRLCDIFGHDVCRKSHTLQWPDIPDEYVRHFLRGAVDGDGSLFKRNDGLWGAGYTSSSKDFVDALVENVERLVGIQVSSGPGSHQSWQARCAGIKAVCLADWLYRDATIALERKAWIAREMMETSGLCQPTSLTPKMRALFPHILDRYEVVERVAQ